MSKQSQIRFVGFADDWEQRKLGDVADICGGGTPSTSVLEYWDGNVDWYAPAEIGEQIFLGGSERKITKLGLEKSSAKMLPIGTVLFTSRAGIGNTAILQKSGCTNQGFQSIIPHQGMLDSYFIFSRTPELKRYGEIMGAGSTFVEVSGKQMANLDIFIPTMPEQKKIGKFFSKLDNLITLHQRKYDKLLNFKKAMLEKMFPREGENKPEIRFSGFTGAWEQRKLGEYLKLITYGFTNPMPDTDEGPWKITAKDIADGEIDYRSARHTDLKAYEKLLTSKSKPVCGDILLTKDGTLGRCAVVEHTHLCINQSVALLRCKQNVLLPSFLNVLLASSRYQAEMLSNAGGGTIKHIYISKIDKMFISVPNLSEQKKIETFFKNLDNLITLHQRKLEKLQNIKKSLLEKMFV